MADLSLPVASDGLPTLRVRPPSQKVSGGVSALPVPRVRVRRGSLGSQTPPSYSPEPFRPSDHAAVLRSESAPTVGFELPQFPDSLRSRPRRQSSPLIGGPTAPSAIPVISPRVRPAGSPRRQSASSGGAGAAPMSPPPSVLPRTMPQVMGRPRRQSEPLVGRTSMSPPTSRIPPPRQRRPSLPASPRTPRDLPPHLVGMYRQVFDDIDKNGDGRVSVKELAQALPSLTLRRIRDLVHSASNQEDESLDFDDFVVVMADPSTPLNPAPISSSLLPEQREVYRGIFDDIKSSSAGVTVADLEKWMPLNHEQCVAIVKDGDRDFDGRLNFREFVEVMADPQTNLTPDPYKAAALREARQPNERASDSTPKKKKKKVSICEGNVQRCPSPDVFRGHRVRSQSVPNVPHISAREPNGKAASDKGDSDSDRSDKGEEGEKAQEEDKKAEEDNKSKRHHGESDSDESEKAEGDNRASDSDEGEKGEGKKSVVDAAEREGDERADQGLNFDKGKWQQEMEERKKAVERARRRSLKLRKEADLEEDRLVTMMVPDHLVQEYRSVFARVDEDHNGSVSPEELAKALNIAIQSAVHLVEEAKEKVPHNLLSQRSLSLNFHEFVALMNKDKSLSSLVPTPSGSANERAEDAKEQKSKVVDPHGASVGLRNSEQSEEGEAATEGAQKACVVMPQPEQIDDDAPNSPKEMPEGRESASGRGNNDPLAAPASPQDRVQARGQHTESRVIDLRVRRATQHTKRSPRPVAPRALGERVNHLKLMKSEIAHARAFTVKVPRVRRTFTDSQSR